MGKYSPLTAGRFIEKLLGQGRYTFTREEASHYSGTSSVATYMSLHRMINAHKIVMPRSGFYVIVDPQHRTAGTLPPEWFIHEMMKDMAQPYYVGLLSAAQLHGAAHHRPQEFQVIISDRAARPVRCGNVVIRFHGKGSFDLSQIEEVKTPTGIMKVSTPETTAWDLVRYCKAAGGLDNVVTVLSELAEKLDAGKLRQTVKRHDEVIVAQRLGYLLDKLGRQDISKGFAPWAKGAPVRALDPAASSSRAPENKKWSLLINAQVEPEA